MKIAIIGGGFTGLAAAIELVDKGHNVMVFEASERPGGLAIGFKEKGWDWSLEKFYHHIFANDSEIIALAKKVGAKTIFKVPVTSIFLGGRISQLDSPVSLLTNPELSVWARLRMAVGLTFLKILPKKLGMLLEKYKATELLPIMVGVEGYKKIWEPLLVAKFGKFVNQVNMAWFWARISKRTKALGYFEGGFEELANKCVSYIRRNGGEVKFGVSISEIKTQRDQVLVNGEKFDMVILTTPAPLVDKLVGAGVVEWPKTDYLWGQTLVLELERSLIDSYWLNIMDRDFPFLVLVEHTKFMNKKDYGGNVLVYIGNYLPEGDSRLDLDQSKLLDLFLPYIQKINPDFKKKWVKRSWKWQAPFAQPVFPINYSKKVPVFNTKLSRVYVANMSMVYPWDRGTNYAVEMGKQVASLVG